MTDLHASCSVLSKEMGYDHFLYAVRVNISLTRPYQFIFSGYPPSWLKHHQDAGYTQTDPVVIHSLKHVVPLLWEQVVAGDDEGAKIMKEARDFGLVSGATFPVHGQAGETGLLSLSSGTAPESARQDILQSLAEAQLFACYLHEAVRCLVLSKEALPVKRPVLTSREKECLLWAAEGKTAWEISNILSLSERTIVFHLANATHKMGAINCRQAVVRAVSMGLVSPQ